METVKLVQVLRRCMRAHGLAEPVASVEEATLRAAGIYGAAPTGCLSMAARVSGFTAAKPDEALYARRSLVRIPAMRGSVYLLPPDLAPFGLALAERDMFTWLAGLGVSDETYGKIAVSVEALLRQGPKTAAELRTGLAGWKPPHPEALTLILRSMSHQGRIVSCRVRGGWRSQLYEYTLTRDWIHLPAKRPTLDQAIHRLAPLYFAANGPATLADFAWWARAGREEKLVKEALDKTDLVTVLLDKRKGIHLADPESLAAIAEERDGVGVALVPYWDAYLMAHADRGRYLERKWEDLVVDKGGNVTNVILRDGRVVGIWDLRAGILKFAPFEPIKATTVREAGHVYEGLEEIKEVVEVRPPAPLSFRGQNTFMAPLR